MAPLLERALVFTDVVDSTRLTDRIGEASAAEFWATHDRRARDLLEGLGGQEVDRADGFFLLFETVTAAVRFGLAYQQIVAALGMSTRVGIHAGPVTLRKSAERDVRRGAKPIEVDGAAKPFAARLMALARGGQTLLSGRARLALDERSIAECELVSHGHYRLKGIDEPAEVVEIGLGGSSFIPPADAEKAYRVVRTGTFWTPVREVRHNLPAERDAFVGRRTELSALAGRLAGGTRLLTLAGSGGTGKSRLACRYGATWLGEWPGGVYFCDLSEARSLDGVAFATAVALGVALGRDDPVAQLGHAIAGRGRCLLILDNFEQVVEHAGATVGRWLDRAAEAVFLITSRERLHIPGEAVSTVEPLALADEAVDLFSERARAQRADFVVDAGNRAAVAQVVRLLDGLPLAIELAAARIGILSPAQLVARMSDRFKLLGSNRGAAARQATLRAAIDWSWNLLAPWEQSALAQCSVFEGGFTLPAAEAVLDLSRWPAAPPAADAVQSLLDKSLLRSWRPGEQGRYALDEPYFAMYLSIHEYAAEKRHGDVAEADTPAEKRHGGYFAAFGFEEALEALMHEGGVAKRRAMAQELDNLVVACRRAIARGDAPVAVATHRATWEVLSLQGPFALGSALGEQVLGMSGIDDAARPVAMMTTAAAMGRAGRPAEAIARFEQALELARRVGHRGLEAAIDNQLGTLDHELGRNDEARMRLSNALSLFRHLGNRRAAGMALADLANLDHRQGLVDASRDKYEAALVIAREVGNRRHEAAVIGNLGTAHREQGRVDEARACYEQALAVYQEVGDRQAEASTHGNLAVLDHELGRMNEALASYTQALTLIREVGYRRAEGSFLGNLGVLHMEQGRFDDARTHLDQALVITRETGNRRLEGMVLSNLGQLFWERGRTDEARPHFEEALAIHRALENRRDQGIVLENLGVLDREADRLADARTSFEAALALHRQVGDRRSEGAALGNLAELAALDGRDIEARQRFEDSEAILRQIGNQQELAKILCLRGSVEAGRGDIDSARAALAEADRIAGDIGAGASAELSRKIAALRDKLTSHHGLP